MTTRTFRRFAMIGVAALVPLLAAGAASADDPPPFTRATPHSGDHRSWRCATTQRWRRSRVTT